MDTMICCNETHCNYTNVLCKPNFVVKSAVINMATTWDNEVMYDKCTVSTIRVYVQTFLKTGKIVAVLLQLLVIRNYNNRNNNNINNNNKGNYNNNKVLTVTKL
jgi:hypothetical protein